MESAVSPEREAQPKRWEGTLLRRLTTFLLLLALVAPAWAQDAPQLITQLQDMDPYVRANAAGSLAYMGEEAKPALPALLDALTKDPEPQVRREVVSALEQLGISVPELEPKVVPGLITALDDKAPEVQLRAVVALQRYPEAAATTADRRFAIVEGLLAGQDEELAYGAVEALSSLKSVKAVARLESLLEDPTHWETAASGIASGGDFLSRQRLVEHLRAKLKTDQVDEALNLLGTVTMVAGAAAPDLRALVTDPAQDMKIRLKAAGLLYELTGEVAGAELIEPGSRSEDAELVDQALSLVYRMRPAQAGAHVPVLVAALKSPEQQIVNSALLILANMGRFSAPAVPAVAGLLTHQEALMRANAAEVLRSMGPAAAGAVPALTRALGDEHMVVRLQAARTLWDLTGNAGPLLPVLKAALTGSDEEAMYLARDLAYVLGPSAREVAAPLLLAELKKGKVDVVYGLDRLGIPLPELLPALEAAFGAAREADQRASLVSMLSSYPAANPDVARLLDRALQDPDLQVRFQAAGLHHMFYRDPQAVLPIVRQALGSEESYQRAMALMQTTEFGPAAADLVPTITSMATSDPDADTRGYALSALWQLTRDLEPIKPIFLTAVRENNLKMFTNLPYDFPMAALGPVLTPADQALLLVDLERWTGPLSDDQIYMRDTMFRLEATLLAAAGAEKALPIIEKAGRSPSASLREAAAEAELLLRRRMES